MVFALVGDSTIINDFAISTPMATTPYPIIRTKYSRSVQLAWSLSERSHPEIALSRKLSHPLSKLKRQERRRHQRHRQPSLRDKMIHRQRIVREGIIHQLFFISKTIAAFHLRRHA